MKLQSGMQLSSPLGMDLNAEKFRKVLVIGLGQVGLPVAQYARDRGFETYGFDVNPDVLEIASSQLGIKKAETFYDMDVLIICISTHKSDDITSPDTMGPFHLAKKISREAKDGSLISIESTVPRGTCRKIFETINHRVHVVHFPHRWYGLDNETHGVNQLRVIGGVCKCCLELGLEFYGTKNKLLLGDKVQNESNYCLTQYAPSKEDDRVENNKRLSIPLYPVTNIEIAEMAKIVENSYRYVQIAFAEELYMYCKENGISFADLRNAINTKWNVEILEPRQGIKGHCLPKDTKMFLQSSQVGKSKIVMAAMESDGDYKRRYTNYH